MSTNSEGMNSHQWQQLNEIFSAAIALEPNHQAEFLRQACAGDECLPREAAAMLAAAQHADRQGFLKGDVFADGAQVLAANDIPPGTIIGPCRVVDEIGRGGMGAVYLALREGFQQRVALKIIKRGMDTESIVRRFVPERDVLASLNHPNIARLLDGGTTDGLPFIAMEYVEGDSITDFCDQNRLTIDERLELFRKVCAAVAYAHHNLVVHRA
jgi:eukaryotic-like serine/threonine-protein kinase